MKTMLKFNKDIIYDIIILILFAHVKQFVSAFVDPGKQIYLYTSYSLYSFSGAHFVFLFNNVFIWNRIIR